MATTEVSPPPVSAGLHSPPMGPTDGLPVQTHPLHTPYLPTQSSPKDLPDFFPGSRESFVCRAGEVTSITSTDFENANRRRHLESFSSSMQEWANYDPSVRNKIDNEKMEQFVNRLIEEENNGKITNDKDFTRVCTQVRKELHCGPSKSQILDMYEQIKKRRNISETTNIKDNKHNNGNCQSLFLESIMKKKAVRSNSGVLVITVLTSPGKFSCPKDCHYCPNEPGQPRSYLSTEPAVLRGNQNGWDAVRQFNDRAQTLMRNGHTVDKIEILVLGGTWSGYPLDYQEEFVRDLFYAANVFNQPTNIRERMSLEEEQVINETAKARIIGLTLETRPDFITHHELLRLRRYGCTRVQIGIQHVDESVLVHINRGCTLTQCAVAMRMLKDCAFKVDIHIMPDLPSSSPSLDLDMFEWILSSPYLQADQWKIYPCEVTPFSLIEKWYQEKLFVPYAESDSELLLDLLLRVKCSVHPWIRLNRVIRDIPNQSIIAGNDKTNLRQMLIDEMKKRRMICKCIRCREIKDKVVEENIHLKIRQYPSFGGEEYFLSFETADEQTIFGLLRLRLPQQDTTSLTTTNPPSATPSTTTTTSTSTSLASSQADNDDAPSRPCGESLFAVEAMDHKKFLRCQRSFSELSGSALVRELHVYGALVAHGEQKKGDDRRHQHTGMGRKLLLAAEVIAYRHGFRKISVIAGIGTKEYYRVSGYANDRTYLSKKIDAVSLQKQAHYFPFIRSVDTTTASSSSVGSKLLTTAQHAVCENGTETGGTTTSDILEATTDVVGKVDSASITSESEDIPLLCELGIVYVQLSAAASNVRRPVPPIIENVGGKDDRRKRKTKQTARNYDKTIISEKC
eukprot:GHVS01105627.1.p1 GENE.GHVS01105627.1~~GHVS01105627.1.p1  ORF type:complete len:852 (+),score=137.91 GHVS01105627.1:194-2749(+)